jgi:tetratricopeptide (TPR) repeat protein
MRSHAIGALAVRKGVLPHETLSDTLPALAAVGLITDGQISSPSRGVSILGRAIALHPLVAEGLRLNSSPRELEVSVGNLVASVNLTIRELDRQNPLTWPIWIALVPHLSQILSTPNTESLDEDVINKLLHIAARVVSSLAIASEHSKSEDLVERVRKYISLFPERNIISITARYCVAHASRTKSFSTIGEHEFRALLDLQVDLPGKDHPDSLHTRHNLAHTLATNGKFNEAIQEFQETIGRRSRVLGSREGVTLSSRHALLFYLIKDGRILEAKQQLDELAALTIDIWSADYPPALTLRHSAAKIRILEQHVESLNAELKDILTRQVRILGEQHNSTLDTRMSLVDVYEAQGKYGQAKAELRIILAHRQTTLGQDHTITRATQDKLSSMSEHN